jgi:hypothetical protein
MIVEDTNNRWIEGSNIWKSGFHLNAFQSISRLSGLVEVLDVHWVEDKMVLMFTLRNLDRTGSLFGPGGLLGSRVEKYQISEQSLIMDIHKSSPFMGIRR